MSGSWVRSSSRLGVGLLATFGVPFAALAQFEANVAPKATLTNVWEMVWTDMESDGVKDLVTVSYDGVLAVQNDSTGQARDYEVIGGFPYDLRVYDLDGNGTQEILAVTSKDEALYVYDFVGGQLQLRGKYTTDLYSTTPPTADLRQPIYTVAAGNLLSDSAQEACPACLEIAVGGEGHKVTILESANLAPVKTITVPYYYVPANPPAPAIYAWAFAPYFPFGGCPKYLNPGNLTPAPQALKDCLQYDNFYGSVRSLDAGNVEPGGVAELLVAGESFGFAVMNADTGNPSSPVQTLSSFATQIDEARLLDLVPDANNRAEIYLGTRDADVSRVLRFDPSPPGQATQAWQVVVPSNGALIQARLAPIDVGENGSKELAVLSGASLTVLDPATHAVLYQNGTTDYFFNAIAGSPDPQSDAVLIGSITGADRNVYLTTVSASAGAIDCSDPGEHELRCFTDEDVTQGRRKLITDNLTALRDKIVEMEGTGALPDAESLLRRPTTGYLWPLSGVTNASEATLDGGAQVQSDFDGVYAGMGFQFYTELTYLEAGVATGSPTLDASTIVSRAARAEQAGTDHILNVAHGTDSYVSANTALAWLSAAPTRCRGFITSELNLAEYYTAGTVDLTSDPDSDPKTAVFDPYVDNVLVPLIDGVVAWNAAHQDNKKFVYLLMKQNFWVAAPAIQDFASRVFGTAAQRAVVVPLVEEGISHAPENNLMAMVGLWRSGYFPKWQTNVIVDGLTLTPARQDHTLAEPSPILRHYVASAALGSYEYRHNLKNFFATAWNFDPTVTKYGNPAASPQNGGHPEVCYCTTPSCTAYPYKRCLNYTDTGLLSMDLFIRLVGLGVIEVPSSDRIVGISPIVWRFDELNAPTSPPDTPFYDPGQLFLWASRNYSAPGVLPASSRWGLFTGFEWPQHPTRSDTYANAYLVGASRYGHLFIPRTQFGLPTILPKSYTPADGSWILGEVETDGWRIGPSHTQLNSSNAAAIKQTILNAFYQGTGALPIRVDGGFGMATKRNSAAGTQKYRVTILDPTYLDPQPIDPTIRTQQTVIEAHDVVPVPGHPCAGAVGSTSVPVHVDAGSICVVDVTVATP